jgi:hypothetical protein
MRSGRRPADIIVMRRPEPETLATEIRSDHRSDVAPAAGIPAPRISPQSESLETVHYAAAKAASRPLFHKATLSRGLVVVERPWR